MLHMPRRTKDPAPPDSLSERERRIFKFLNANPIGVLSSVTPDGEPHGSAIYFGVDEHFSITFLTKIDTRKYDNIAHHNHVTLTVFEAASQTTAQITGVAQEITDSYEINRVAGFILSADLKTSDAGAPPITKLEAGPYVAFRIKPHQIRMAVYARPDPGEYTDLFETLETFDLENI